MITSIYFIHRFHFNKQYYIQDQFELFKRKGFDVKYIDIVSIIKSKHLEDTCPDSLKDNVIYFDRIRNFRSFFKEQKGTCIVISDIGFQGNSAWFFRILSKYNIPYCSTDSGFSKVKEKAVVTTVKNQVNEKIRRLRFSKLIKKPLQLLDYYCTKLILKPADLLLIYRRKVRKRLRKVCDQNTRIVYTNSPDWDVAMQEQEERIVKDRYVVFIDQYIPYHPDFIMENISIKASQYYHDLNLFLKKIQEQTGLKIVIAAHPRRMNQHDDDYPFDIIYNKTANLVRYSEFVLLHYSSAINFAIIYSKPMIFLNSPIFKKDDMDVFVNDMASNFHCQMLNFSDIALGEKEGLVLNTTIPDAYRKYKEEHLQHPMSDGKMAYEHLLEFIESFQNK